MIGVKGTHTNRYQKIKAGERLLDFPTPLQSRKSNSEKEKEIKKKNQNG